MTTNIDPAQSTVQAGQPGLDPDVVRLTKAVRQVESGGNYQLPGKSGEYGGYQFLPATWDQYSKDAGVNVPLQQASKEQQNEVAYKKMKQWKDAGHNIGQIASMWNAGEGAPNAYLQNNIGTNSKGVTYNTPAYAKKVAQLYQQYKTSDATDPMSQQSPNTTSGGNHDSILDGIKSIANFAFPIVGDIGSDLQGTGNKTALQQLGDAGLSALWFIPGIGEAGEAGVNAARLAPMLGETGTKIAGQALGGAGLGYGADVASNLSQGKTGLGAVTPGLGTLSGGLLGGGLTAAGSAFSGNAGRIVNSLVKPLQKDFAYGKNPGRAVAGENIVANSLGDLSDRVDTRHQQIGEAIGKLGDSISPHVSLDISQAISPVDEAMRQAASTNNSALVDRLKEIKTALTQELGIGKDEVGNEVIASKGARKLSGLSYNDAQQFKSHVNNMTNWTGRASDDKAVNAALQDVWRNVSKSQQDAIRGIPEIGQSKVTQLRQLNQRYGDLTQAKVALKHRLAVEERQNLIGRGDTMAGLATGAITEALTGNPLGAIGAGLAGGLARHLMGSTAFKTRAASGLSKLSGGRSVLEAKKASEGLVSGLAKKTIIRATAGH